MCLIFVKNTGVSAVPKSLWFGKGPLLGLVLPGGGQLRWRGIGIVYYYSWIHSAIGSKLVVLAVELALVINVLVDGGTLDFVAILSVAFLQFEL